MIIVGSFDEEVYTVRCQLVAVQLFVCVQNLESLGLMERGTE